ncbi:MAG: aminotransferase class III-fold pyridoxal phosphate-dependent enzyme [Firmicutes bacterium]|nr:aminotransferase class III-fold pyridoxal phosphate-dependent enzyme [Bacillota bacterium]MCM1401123.1 aminotransferase class III-fold pyridoxal phosphate-dependent enzyme [Bacteroides sp.]MCM1477054.1 aminotransferase class III-fold pyridoxal phosphate-dependent enzyme [Bacteroides sp.]
MELFDVYSLYDIEPVKAQGNYVFTADGTPYLDFYGGHAVISIGHCHPHYVDALTKQIGKLGFYSNSVKNGLQQKLAVKLGNVSGYNDYKLFLCNSGAEANENAMKLVSFYTGRKKILAFSQAFHGRTSGAVAVTDNPKIVSPFNVSDNVDFSPFNNVAKAVEKLCSREYAAVIVEPIQGVGGIRVASSDFLQALSKACREAGTLFIADEVQSGYGRTGSFFAHQHSDIRPDIITCAKGIANGFPMGAVLIAPHIKPWKGMLGTTFGGNHMACAAAIAVLDVIESEKLIDNAREVGSYLKNELEKIRGVKDVRGKGLMVGFDVDGSAGELRKRLLFEKKIFTGGAGEHTVRLLPALTINKTAIDNLVSSLKQLLEV